MNTRNNEKDSTLAIQCYTHIEENIMNGRFAPGKKLKVRDLKEALNVGQSPIREALSRLVATGLVEMEDNKGFRVSGLSEDDIRDIYITFLEIELLALKKAMQLGDDAWEASVVGALHQLSLVETKKEEVEYAVWAERNYAFHLALISGCKSPLLMHLRAEVYRRSERYCRIAFNLSHMNLELNHEEHKKLAEAVLRRDEKAVVKLMTHHSMGSLEDVITVLKKNKLI